MRPEKEWDMRKGSKNYNTLIVGASGPEKRFLIHCILETSKTYCVVFDYEKRDLLPRKNHHKILWYADATNDNDIEDTLFRVFDLMAFRFEHKREQHKSKLDEPVLFVIIEEPSVILKGSHKQQYRFILDRLSSIGRGVEIYLIMFVNSEKNILPTTIMDNMVNKVCFSQCDHKQYKKLFGLSLDKLEPERAYVLTPNISKPKMIMSINVWDTVCDIE